jgi:hypothetical protein
MLLDMVDPENPVEVSSFTLSKIGIEEVVADAAASRKWELAGGDTLLIQGADSEAALKLGDGAKHVALAEALQSLYGSLKIALELWGGVGGHTHLCTGPGSPSGPPVPTLAAPSWDAGVASQKLTVPAN